MDMHSGGGTKEPPYEYIYIEAPREEAELVFYHRFGHNPHRVTCTCCGEDYEISEGGDLKQLTGYNRGCAWLVPIDKDQHKSLGCIELGEDIPPGYTARKPSYDEYITLEQYLAKFNVLVIRAEEISPEERVGQLPEEGYIWH